MTRYWPTVVMALMLAGLGLYVYLVEFPAKQTEEREQIIKKKVLTLEEQAITSITYRTDRDELVFERAPEKDWMMTSPLRTEGDSREVQSLIRAVVMGTVQRVVEENPAELAPFGLDKPVTTVTIKAGSGEEEAIEVAVEEELGIAFISRLAAERGIALGRVVEVAVEGMDLRRNIYLARNRRRSLTRAQAKFWEHVEQSRQAIPGTTVDARPA